MTESLDRRLDALSVGARGEFHWEVDSQHTIHLGAPWSTNDGVVVFSTPAMIMLMELTAKRTIATVLQSDEESVGVSVAVEHLAATPLGATVRCEATLTSRTKNLLDFEIAAFDAKEQIGRGTHQRAVVRVEKLRDKLKSKSDQLKGAIVAPLDLTPDPSPLPALRTLSFSSTGPRAQLTLNRPHKLNAVNAEMTGELEKVNRHLAAHPEIRVVEVRGGGRAFCAGDDVPEVGTMDLSDAGQLSLRQARIYLQWEQLPQVLIAAVQGPAMGAGCVAAMACDFRIASPGASFGMPEILLGWPPGYGLQQLVALVGRARAMELCLTGQPISARQAAEQGLVHRVAPGNQLDALVDQLVEQLLKTPALALRETKRLLRGDVNPQHAVGHLAATAAYVRCLSTPDAREGIAAFEQKRPPQFE